MPSHIIIRQAKPQDASAIALIVTLARQKHYKHMFSVQDLFEGGAIEDEKDRANRLTSKNKELTFLALKNDVPVFDASLEFDTPKYGIGVTEVTSFFGHPKYNRQGIATKMFRHLLETAKIHNQKELVLCALENNHTGRTFYKNMGGTLNGNSDTVNWCGKKFKRLYYTWPL